ncbi:hypothetical protein ABEB36_003910 [Hypothenemus hampei]
MFMDRTQYSMPARRRSEARLKTYNSSTDVRNWCDVIEDRRQHILDLVMKDFDKTNRTLIPLNALLDIVLAIVNMDISKLKSCLKQIWSFIDNLSLSGDDLKTLQNMTNKMDAVCKGQISQKLAEVRTLDLEEYDPNCVATDRHFKERASIERLVRGTLDPRIEMKLQGPGKLVTRIKGLQPGYQVMDDPSQPTRVIIKPSRRFDHSTDSQVINKLDIASEGKELNPDKVTAMEALCKEQRDTIESLTKERNDLKMKLYACIRELENFKTVANPSLSASCQQEIEALEAEIRIMRSGSPTPEEEGEIIQKEIQILKSYCVKLKEVENENEKLKVELESRAAVKDSGMELDKEKVETLKDKLKHLEELTRERDSLAEKVRILEKKLHRFEDLPEDVEVLKSKSDMLDTVMQERDGLNQKMKMMKGMEEQIARLKVKADRVDDLERELKTLSKGGYSSGIELKKTQSKAGNLEVELQNVRCERDAMKNRIDNLKKELDMQRNKATETEMFRLERDRLQIKLNELAEVQAQYEELIMKMKFFDNIKDERDMYKQKYEDVLDMECKCDMLKAQVDEARAVSRERDHLQKQVQDLEACICEQEDEIKHLVVQVDNLSKTKNDTNHRLNSFKEEIAKKDRLLASSQEQLVQSKHLAGRVRELEKLLHNAEHTILQKDCHIKCLENQISCRTSNKIDSSVDAMRRELEAAKAENRRLQEIANKMMVLNGDDHVRRMLKHSECAVKRVVQEIGKQYKEWDQKKPKYKGKLGLGKEECGCKPDGDISSGDDCEKLREELEELQKEKQKLELTVKQLQSERT